MSTQPLSTLIRRLRRAACPRGDGALTDAQLLDRWTDRHDEAAFELLLWRHGPMVLDTCRRLLHDTHDAEDAFQAAWLVLMRKAGSLRNRDAIGAWMHRVAYRVALRARAAAARRASHERPGMEVAAPGRPDELVGQDVRTTLDEEIDRLPAHYRRALVLCCLEGLSQAEAARRLGCPQGTLSCWLTRARQRLRIRLARRGLALTAAASGTVLAEGAVPAVVPATLGSATLKTAMLLAAGKAATGILPASAVILAEEVSRAMFMTKLRPAVLVLIGLSLAGAAAGLVIRPPRDAAQAQGQGAARRAAAQGAPEPQREPDQTEAAARRESERRLSTLGLAMHEYYDIHHRFPPAAVHGKDGKPLLSWRVLLLPFLGAKEAALYQRFRLDQPWDSAHNKRLLARMPAVYAAVRAAPREPGFTFYQVFVGKGTVFEGNSGLRTRDIPDGLSGTVLAAEAGSPVAWTRPADLPYAPDKALPRLGGMFNQGFHVLMASGRVRFIKRPFDEQALRGAVERNDGRSIDWDGVLR